MLHGTSGNGYSEGLSDVVKATQGIDQWREILEWNDNKRNT